MKSEYENKMIARKMPIVIEEDILGSIISTMTDDKYIDAYRGSMSREEFKRILEECISKEDKEEK